MAIDTAIVDASALYAAIDEQDAFHQPCASTLSQPTLRLVIPALCVAEVAYMVEKRLGAEVEARFLEGLAELDVRAPELEDWVRIGELVRQYADFPLGGTDASVVALAERLKTDIVVTLDRRHFATVRPTHCESLRILPE